MEDGQGLLVIAIIFITFINWLSQTLKKKAAKKRGEPAEPVTAATKVAQYIHDQEVAEPTSPQRPGPEMGVREFLAALSGTETPQQPQPVPVITQQQNEQEQIKVQEIEPVTEISDWGTKQRTEITELGNQNPEHTYTIRSVSKPKKTHTIALKLRSEGGAKEAIVLSEILGKPKAFTDY